MRWSVKLSDVFRIIRFYQAAALNAAFGYGLYAMFIAIGTNIYLAQILSHCLGVAFNYFTYSRHAFKNHTASPRGFIFVYGVNYLIGLGLLMVLSQYITSPYLAGFCVMVLASLLNYFLLSRIVFVPHVAK